MYKSARLPKIKVHSAGFPNAEKEKKIFCQNAKMCWSYINYRWIIVVFSSCLVRFTKAKNNSIIIFAAKFPFNS